jgi:hypothetical protein
MPETVDPALEARTLAWARISSLGPTAFQTLPIEVDVQIYRNNRRATVVLLASDTEGAGPCRDGECLGILPPLQQIGRASGTTSVSIPWTPTGPVGSVVHMQAALMIGGRVVDVSDVASVTILPFYPGCTRPESPDYDPTANWDDGTCACPGSVVAASAAELAPYLGCADLGHITLTGAHDSTTSFPNLVRADEIVVDGASMTHLSFPALTDASTLDVRSASSLLSIEAPALVWLERWFVVEDDPSLTTITLPPAMSAAQIVISGSHQLTDLTLPRLLSHPAGTTMIGASGDNLTRLTLLGSDPPSQVIIADAPSLTTLDIGSLGTDSSLTLSDLPRLSTWTGALPPALYELELYRLPALATHNLAGVEHIESGQIAYVPWTTLSLPDLASATSLWLHDAPSLTAIALPGLTSLSSLAITDNPVLTSLWLPALGDTDWSIGVDNNPSLCATTVPQIASPPPGCSAYGSGNSCDP